MASQPRHESDQRRLVNVSPGEMLAARHVVELVAEEAIVIDSGKLDEELGSRKASQQGRGADDGVRAGDSEAASRGSMVLVALMWGEA